MLYLASYPAWVRGYAIIIMLICLYYSELYEAERWHSDSKLWTPMTILGNGEHVFIGDIVDIAIDHSISGKIVRFVEVHTNLIHRTARAI